MDITNIWVFNSILNDSELDNYSDRLEDSQQVDNINNSINCNNSLSKIFDKKISLVNTSIMNKNDIKKPSKEINRYDNNVLNKSINKNNNNNYYVNNCNKANKYNRESHMTFDKNKLKSAIDTTKDNNKENENTYSNSNNAEDFKSLIKQNKELKQKLLNESQLAKKNKNNIEEMIEEYTKLNMKNNALLIYSSSLQKRLDYIEIDRQEKISELSMIKSNDINKILNEKELLIKTLEKELKHYKEENNSLKTFNTNDIEENSNNELKNIINKEIKSKALERRIDKLLESYIQENKKLKRINNEYLEKEVQCNKQWNNLLNENKALKNKIDLLIKQLEDQKEEYNSILKTYDEKLINTLNEFPRLLKEYEELESDINNYNNNNNNSNSNKCNKSTAAEYLVEQINYFMEERRKEMVLRQDVLNDNNMLALEKQEFIKHITKLESFIEMACNVEDNKNNSYNLRKLKLKIEELEDIIYQNSNINYNYSKVADLEEVIVNLNKEIQHKEIVIDNIKYRLNNYINNKDVIIFDEKEAIKDLTKAIRDKDEVIVSIRSQLAENKVKDVIKNSHLVNYNSYESNIIPEKNKVSIIDTINNNNNNNDNNDNNSECIVNSSLNYNEIKYKNTPKHLNIYKKYSIKEDISNYDNKSVLGHNASKFVYKVDNINNSIDQTI